MSTSTAEERWARAAQLAADLDDDRLRHRRRLVLWLSVGVVVLWVVGTVLVARLMNTGPEEAGDDSITPRLVVGALLMLLGFLGALAGLIWAIATRRLLVIWRAIEAPLSRAEGRSVRRQIAFKEQVDLEHRTTVVAAAIQAQRQAVGIVPSAIAFVVFFLGGLIAVGDTPGRVALYSATLLLFVGLVIANAGQYRRLRRFIAENGAGSGEQSAREA